MKTQDLWMDCPVFMTIKSGKHTFSYVFYVKSFDQETKLFIVEGQQAPLKGFTFGLVETLGNREDLPSFHRWSVTEEWFKPMSSLPSKADKNHDREALEANLKRWRASKKGQV